MTILREPAVAPVQGTERMDALDAVRGAAVLGILLANVVAMSGFPFLAPAHYQSLPLAEWLPHGLLPGPVPDRSEVLLAVFAALRRRLRRVGAARGRPRR